VITLQQTVEFVESRAHKLSGAQVRFTGRVLSEYQQEKMLNFQQEETDINAFKVSEKDAKERKKYLQSLNKQIKKYNINHIRDFCISEIEETKEHMEYATDYSRTLVDQVLRSVDGMAAQHRNYIEEGEKDIIENCFESYAFKIEELEQKDIKQLKLRKQRLAEMKRNILKDLEDAQFDKEEKLRERERIHSDNNAFMERRYHDNLRM